MIPDFCLRARTDVLHKLLLTRLDKRTIDLRPEQRSRLTGQVVADHDHVDQIAHLVAKKTEPIEPEPQRLVQKCLAKRRLGHEVHEPALQTAQIPTRFVDHARDAADDRVGRFVSYPRRLFSQPGEPAWIVPLGERIVGDIGRGGLGQGVMGDVHEVRLIVGHRPDHAELVAQVVPEPPVAVVLRDAALIAVGGLRGDVAGVDVEPFQNRLARPGKLLHGIHDDDVVLDA